MFKNNQLCLPTLYLKRQQIKKKIPAITMNNNQRIAMDNISADNIRMLITTTMDMYNLQFLINYRISPGFNCWKSKVFFFVLVIGSLSDYSFKVFFFWF